MSSPLSAAEAMVRIRMAMQSNDLAGARSIAESASRDHPSDAALADVAGTLALRAKDTAKAKAHFERACALAPALLDYALNHAITLQQLGLHGEAIALLKSHEKTGRDSARYASIRALSHRSLAEPGEAVKWYDIAVAQDARNSRALHGRARVALERGEADALSRFDTALSANPGDPDLWLGKAQALEVAGDINGARVVAEQICAQAPGFVAALSFLSSLKLGVGESDFTSPFAEAESKAPHDPNIASAHIDALAGIGHASRAVDVSAKARARFPNEPHFALLEAVHAGSAGEWDRAEAIFATLPTATPDRFIHEARHRIRAHDLDRANAMLDRAMAAHPWDITAWALRGIVWRLSDDADAKERAQWLHEQQGLVQMRPLIARNGLVDDATELLRALHSKSAMPLGQSLRGGTQTRGVLFHRTEPLLAELRHAILATLEDFRLDLPAADATHPLLRHAKDPWALAGSWSVRLNGGGDHHTSHVHPQGIVSSALYLVVPEDASGIDDDAEYRGWLEVGRPPIDLGLDIAPIRSIEPKVGYLALFPSTLYHGTTSFDAAERLTVAFDVTTNKVNPNQLDLPIGQPAQG